jgi:hypothetical protein
MALIVRRLVHCVGTRVMSDKHSPSGQRFAMAIRITEVPVIPEYFSLHEVPDF